MRNWIKQNPTLACGIFLPVIVMAFFTLAEVLPQRFVEPPTYDLLFAQITPGSHGNSYEIRSENGRIATQFMTHGKNQMSYTMGNTVHLYRVHITDMSVKDTTMNPPPILQGQDDDKWHDFTAPELALYKLDTNAEAPDGYRYQWGRNTNEGMFLFTGGYSPEGYIEKSGRRMRIPTLGTERWKQPVFLGWILSDNEEYP